MSELKIGKKAPQFSLVDQTGSTRELREFLKRYTVLYFYPKDDTPGCTLESRELSQSSDRLMKLGATVVGILGGDVASKKKFCDKYDLKIPLLADSDFSISKSYGAYGEKKFMGRSYLGILRKTFVLDESGTVIKVYPSVKPQGHADELVEYLSGLSSPKTSTKVTVKNTTAAKKASAPKAKSKKPSKTKKTATKKTVKRSKK